jgi:hypothetical protein
MLGVLCRLMSLRVRGEWRVYAACRLTQRPPFVLPWRPLFPSMRANRGKPSATRGATWPLMASRRRQRRAAAVPILAWPTSRRSATSTSSGSARETYAAIAFAVVARSASHGLSRRSSRLLWFGAPRGLHRQGLHKCDGFVEPCFEHVIRRHRRVDIDIAFHRASPHLHRPRPLATQERHGSGPCRREGASRVWKRRRPSCGSA